MQNTNEATLKNEAKFIARMKLNNELIKYNK